jgi:thiol:disulfide interchange protein
MRHLAALVAGLMCLAAVAGAATDAPAAAPYDPTVDGWKQLEAAGQQAAASGKRMLVVVGGNWCKWCRALDRLMTTDPRLESELSRFVVVHLNYSKENKNPEAMAKLGNPDKLGFPSLLVLTPQLQVLRAQSSEIFETGDPAHPGHDPAKILAFLERWERKPTPAPAT